MMKKLKKTAKNGKKSSKMVLFLQKTYTERRDQKNDKNIKKQQKIANT